ncbi:Store-operated calcium entry regulator STIMATE [Microtus ochrogaster]|uniref:Store-operated calcium entry regulator STIMATE n=1 Tax=Microtus ochrogaster TaxID=79684 RepID=A0A8J6KRR3_MICOH|nr:Store-operated calcium entry regulator STIMATE [Microtus ochrogaster]
MQGSGGNVSRGLPGGPASTVASGAGRCESGALMHSFGIFLQGLLGVVAFSTLMRESRTPAPPRPRRRPWASPTPGTLLPVEFRPGDRALGLRCLPLPARPCWAFAG